MLHFFFAQQHKKKKKKKKGEKKKKQEARKNKAGGQRKRANIHEQSQELANLLPSNVADRGHAATESPCQQRTYVGLPPSVVFWRSSPVA